MIDLYILHHIQCCDVLNFQVFVAEKNSPVSAQDFWIESFLHLSSVEFI